MSADDRMVRTETPDFTDLLKRDLIAYCESCGLSPADANRKALELLEFVEREAGKFAPPAAPDYRQGEQR